MEDGVEVVRRMSSEYSQSESAMAHMEKKLKSMQTFSPEELAKSRNKIYKMLIQEPMAKLAIIPSLLWGATPIIGYLLFGKIINVMAEYANGEIESALPQVSKLVIISFCVLGILSAVCVFLDTFLWVRAGSRLSVRIRDEVFTSIMKNDVTFFDVTPVGQILTVLGEDTAVIQELFGPVKGQQLQSLGQFLIGIILTYYMSWRIGLIMTALVPFYVIVIKGFHPAIRTAAQTRFRYVATGITIGEETLAAIRTVKGFNTEEYDEKRFADKNEEGANYEKKMIHLIVAMMTIVMTVMWGSVLGCFYYGATLVGTVQSGKMFVVGDLFSVFGFMNFGSMGIVSLARSFNMESRAINAGARVIRLITHQASVNFDGGATYDDFKGRIEFSHVSFSYPTRSNMALCNVSFAIEPGQTGALVGHSGSGKSTCVQLLERYYDVTEGMILIDGHDIRELDPRWLHRQIGLVSQEPTLFQKSVRNNVLYGLSEPASDDVVWAALEAANAKKFVTKLEGQLDYMVGDRGNSLSGGQKQRIAIARAIIKDPGIMITDEATSALDAESEKKVQAALDKVLSTRTGVVVAHRLTTIRNADIIFVFDAGQIVERGTHEELVAKKGKYYELVFRQLSAADRGEEKESDNSEK